MGEAAGVCEAAGSSGVWHPANTARHKTKHKAKTSHFAVRFIEILLLLFLMNTEYTRALVRSRENSDFLFAVLIDRKAPSDMPDSFIYYNKGALQIQCRFQTSVSTKIINLHNL